MTLAPWYKQLHEVVTFYSLDQYQRDSKTYLKLDHWRPLGFAGVVKGDCEDFALGYYCLLWDLGWPAERLSLATCLLYSGQMHCVLLAETENGTFVLDCRHRFALPYRSRILSVKKWYACGGPLDQMWCKIVQPTGSIQAGIQNGAPVSEKIEVSGNTAIPAGLSEFQKHFAGA